MPIANRACNHCGGDLYLVEDTYDKKWHCIQCGREQDPLQTRCGQGNNDKGRLNDTSSFNAYSLWAQA